MSGASTSRRRPSNDKTRASHSNTNDKGGPTVERQYVGIDLHRRRSVIVRMTPEGEKLDVVRIENDPVAMAMEVAKAGPGAGGGLRGRDRRCDPLLRSRPPGLLGRAHPPPPGVRHHRAPGPHHQDGMWGREVDWRFHVQAWR